MRAIKRRVACATVLFESHRPQSFCSFVLKGFDSGVSSPIDVLEEQPLLDCFWHREFIARAWCVLYLTDRHSA
jgi:hypothetical protein